MNKQYKMLSLVMMFYYEAQKALALGADFDAVIKLPIRDDIARFKYIPEQEVDRWFDLRKEQLLAQLGELTG